MTEKRLGPAPGVCLREVSVKRELTVLQYIHYDYPILLLCNFFSVHGKVKPKPLSFQEFNNTTSDAWGEDDDDVIKVDPEEKRNTASQPRVRTISGGDVRASIPAKAGTEPKKLPEQLMKKEEHKTSRPSPLSLLSKDQIY